MTNPVLSIRDLHVRFRTNSGEVHAVKGISLDIAKGETLAIVGESGSGKSQTMLASLGLLASNGVVTGSATLGGDQLIGASNSFLNTIRGRKVTMIFQEPMTSLDPLFTIGDQIVAVIRRHRKVSRSEAKAEAIEHLKRVKIPTPEDRFDAYPHEMSGGQRQRVMIAIALANRPDLLVADEPTTALDVTIQAEILDLLAELQRELGMAIAFITHDLGIVRRFANRVAVMRYGEVVETGPTSEVFAKPKHPYTQMLLDAEPKGSKPPGPADAPVILKGDDVKVHFALRSGFLGRGGKVVKAVDGVSFALKRGETIGIVGESGSGKSTLGRAVLQLYPASGMIRFEDRALTGLTRDELRPLRRSLQLVFQDPYGSLSPRMTVGQIITEGLLVHEPTISASERDRRAGQALEEVSLDAGLRNRFPHEFSGGQRQRIAIARAMILKPKLVILDEPTSALDRSVQRQIVELLRDLQEKNGLSYLFISHDLAVVRAMSDTIMVMKDGKVVEAAATETLLKNPREAYTQRLLAAALTDLHAA
ncbi:MAG: ABC transporter ATP-binding protein [Proteobacteria bacterium]|nr:ABC transporter ATP-binding protein [Pseudomonadota bacterium]